METSTKMKPQTQYKLEYKLLFSLVVAGKSAKFAEKVMRKFLPLSLRDVGVGPFWHVRTLAAGNDLGNTLRDCKSGNYTKLEHAFKSLVEADLDLRLCSPQDLEKIKGIGPKTSRFFILWTRPNARYAALDTHILKWMRYLGYNAPLTTPTGKKYAELELAFLAEADERKIKPAKLDYAIWEYCRDGKHKDGQWPKELSK